MNIQSIIVLLIVLIWACISIWYMKQKKGGCCSGSCDGCTKKCQSNQRKRNHFLLLSLLLLIGLMTGCKDQQKEENTAAKKETTSAAQSTTQALSIDTKGLDKNAKNIVTAMEQTKNLSNFTLNTKALISLNGTYVKGDFHINSDVHIINEDDHLLMKTENEVISEEEEISNTSYYKDGWYYIDDENGKTKIEEKQEDVMDSVSEITNLVIHAAKNLQDVSVKQQGDHIIYTYRIPQEMAKDYITQLIEELSGTIPDFFDINVSVDSVQLVSEINEEGLLESETIAVEGAVKKAMFKIPAKVNMKAEFEKTEEEISFPSFDEYIESSN